MTRPAVLIGTSAVVALAAAAFFVTRGGDRDTAGDAGTEAGEPASAASSRGGRPSALPAPDAPGSARLSGRVVHRRTGAAAAGVELSFAGPVDVSLEADADGGFSATLAPGRYRVSVVEPGLRVSGPDVVQVASGAIVDGVDIEVDDAARVAGRVVDGDGNPLSEATVTCRMDGRSPAASPCESTSGDDGAFEIEVPAGALELIARGRDGTGSGAVALPWVLPGVRLAGVEVVVDRDATVAGVVRTPDGAPQPGASVRVWAEPPAEPGAPSRAPVATAETGPDGRFEVGDLAPGAVRVVAFHRDLAPSTAARVELAAGDQTGGLALVLRRPLAISGRVVGGSNEAVAGARVVARRSSTGERVAAAPTDETGQFDLGGLDSGPFDLATEAPGRAPGRRSAIAAPATDVVLKAPAPAALAGTVTAAGAPVTDFRVHLFGHVPVGGGRPAPDVAPQRVVDSGGRFRFDGLEPGSYQLRVSAAGLGPSLRKVVAPPGATGSANVELTTGSVLVGTVTDASSGRGIAGALVSAATGFAGDGAYTDANGEYRLRDIAAGRRSIRVIHPAYVGKIEGAVEFGVGDRRRLDVRLDARRSGATGQVIEFAGIGAVLSMADGGLVVGDVLEHAPAAVAGLRPGDRVARIDGVNTAGRTLADNIEDIRGLVGTSVRLDIVRGAERFTLDVVRGTVRFRADD